MIALIVVGGIFLLGVIVTGVLLYLFATSDAGKTAIKVIGDSTQLAEKGMKAPGAAEIRALGCEQAMVLDMQDFAIIVNDITDAGPDAGLPDELMITCQVGGFKTPPACDDIASTYVRAVGTAKSNFVVSVQRQGNNNQVCQVEYDSTGSSLGAWGGGGGGGKRR